MGAYNAAHNAEKAARRTAKRFADLTGDRWTTAELRAQGFTDRNIRTFCKDGLIKKLYQGRYQRVSKRLLGRCKCSQMLAIERINPTSGSVMKVTGGT